MNSNRPRSKPTSSWESEIRPEKEFMTWLESSEVVNQYISLINAASMLLVIKLEILHDCELKFKDWFFKLSFRLNFYCLIKKLG